MASDTPQATHTRPIPHTKSPTPAPDNLPQTATITQPHTPTDANTRPFKHLPYNHRTKTMPTITIDDKACEFEPGQTILQIANANGIDIPQYCYHDGLSIVASCRICLAEVWAPNPRNDNKLEPIPKLLPTCQTTAADGQVVYTASPKAIANQKSVMEYLLINHPLDCPVCDQSGECLLQDYSYEYGRGVSRFEEAKVKQPKKDLGPHVLLYSDRCIMCSRCVRFTREVTGTAELIVQGRGNQEQIDIFPGIALDNELSANVIDLCPVGALLDKDFLFTQRVWYLNTTPSIDGITAQGDNIFIEHNKGNVYRIKPRENPAVNKWWISDEIRYGYKFVHDESRITTPRDRAHNHQRNADWGRAYKETIRLTRDLIQGAAGTTASAGAGAGGGGGLAVMVSPMLSCEDAFLLAQAAKHLDPSAVFAVGPIPFHGQDKPFPGGYTVRAEKAPNARGVRRVLEAVSEHPVLTYEDFLPRLDSMEFQSFICTGNYPSEWVTEELAKAATGKHIILIDTLPNRLTPLAEVLLPAATWVEKSGTFENVDHKLQAFEQAIPTIGLSRSEAQIALDLIAIATGEATPGDVPETSRYYPDAAPGQVPSAMEIATPIGTPYNPANTRQHMAQHTPALECFITDIDQPAQTTKRQSDMALVEF